MSNTPVEINQLQLAVLRALGATFEGNVIRCSGRKGIVYLRTSKGTAPIAHNKLTGKPIVSGCEHEGADSVANFISEVALANLMTVLFGGKEYVLPKPEDFFYVFVEDLDNDNEPEITDTSDAATVLAAIQQL
ncbi:hypothetical protein [Rhodoferax fermentans]|uniref:Uncharacterized protein n=1 Tax=Rhodoferax fermentans TaxID=28066 RepID=A0A1T1AP62_RHOFE|nr:hypothetical protein [Rhodoferax fermentans]OOV05783.1 hypothetical protein RF819_02825 [Rhodoferax fermentans]